MENKIMFLALAGLVPMACTSARATAAKTASKSQPNIILIYTDDQGYADLSCYNAKGFTTPNIDRMAEIGMRYTDFYQASNLSTPSRAGIMTGCYPNRIGVHCVLVPKNDTGLSQSETTVPEMLSEVGYNTVCIGKWHLGHLPGALPCDHGFQQFFGLPYSVDMASYEYVHHVPAPEGHVDSNPLLPLYMNNDVIETEPDLNMLTTRYTRFAVNYIKSHADGKPFFMYFAHSMPHVPLGVSDKFRGKSELGLYGDVIMEIDWSVGEVYKALEEAGIADNTLVIFSSDNGPSLKMGEHGGHAEPLREGKTTTFDGGHRVPCLMTWPGVIPAGYECTTPAAAIDLLPTFARMTGAPLPANEIDGEDIYEIMTGEKKEHGPIYFFGLNAINGVRIGDYKYHKPHGYNHLVTPGKDGWAGKLEKLELEESLFNIVEDPGESVNVINEHPDIAKKLKEETQRFGQYVKDHERPMQTYSR